MEAKEKAAARKEGGIALLVGLLGSEAAPDAGPEGEAVLTAVRCSGQRVVLKPTTSTTTTTDFYVLLLAPHCSSPYSPGARVPGKPHCRQPRQDGRGGA